MAAGSLYCTVAEARAAGAVGTDEQVEGAIRTAGELIDRYTGTVWAEVTATIIARVSADGTAILPLPVAAVTAVRFDGASSDLAPTAYRATSSLELGGVDALLVGAGRGSNVLIAGAEPWNGGYANLYGGYRLGTKVRVTGLFGPPETPPFIRDAAAALAAWLTTGGSLVPPSPSTPPNPNAVDTDDEGNVLSITVDATAPVPNARTTGLATVDAVLAAWVVPFMRIN